MNAIELLEALLRGPAGTAPSEAGPQPARTRTPEARGPQNRGADILRDILGGGTVEPAAPQAPAPASRPLPSGSQFPTVPAAEYEEEDLPTLLRQAEEREAAAAAGRPYRPTAPSPTRRPSGGPEVMRQPAPAPAPTSRPRDEEATLLIRAMINAARADGRLDRDEEQKILQQLGQPSREVVAFIQAEFQKPLDVKDFAWSIPLGLEQKVYAISLSVIEIDQREESSYLQDLAHGLRLAPEIRAGIHQHFGAPLPS